MKPVFKIMLSSTSLDLPEHRLVAQEACLDDENLPIMMERLPASSDVPENNIAIKESMRLVASCDVYVGIYANRYGHIPPSHEISITEMEFLEAVRLEKPRLIFIAHDDHPPLPHGETDPEAIQKLQSFKKRLSTDYNQIVKLFKSASDLRVQMMSSLKESALRRLLPGLFQSEVPLTPAPYRAHPYTLMQTPKLIGRREELQSLDRWVGGSVPELKEVAVYSLIAVGGMGKSALTYAWFESIETSANSGRFYGKLWWSFYDAHGSFEDFVLYATAYFGQLRLDDIRKLKLEDQMRRLLSILDQRPFLLVLDGVERLLLAYAQLDAARMRDGDLDQQTANTLFTHVQESLQPADVLRKHFLRFATDRRAGRFLTQLALLKRTRVLITSRLPVADLQLRGVEDRPHSRAVALKGLSIADALQLWRSRGGAPGPHVQTFLEQAGCHPLMIQILANAVKDDLLSNGNLDIWLNQRPEFRPTQLDIVQVHSEILFYALQGISPRALAVLRVIAAFLTPTNHKTLVEVLCGLGKTCDSRETLDTELRTLINRGFLARDGQRFEMHPIVRGVVWEKLDTTDRKLTCKMISQHFLPYAANPIRDVQRLEDLAPLMELFQALVGQEDFEKAREVFFEHLARPMLGLLNAHRLRVQLLEALFPNGPQRLPPLARISDQAQAANAMAIAYRLVGRPGPAARISRMFVDLLERNPAEGFRVLGPGRGVPIARATRNLAISLVHTGELREAERCFRLASHYDATAVDEFKDYWVGLNAGWLGWLLSITGRADEAREQFAVALEMAKRRQKPMTLARVKLQEFQLRRWINPNDNFEIELRETRLLLSENHKEEIDVGSKEREDAAAVRMLASLARHQGRVEEAERMLHAGLAEAREFYLIQEEVAFRIDLAELFIPQSRFEEAREQLDAVWVWVEFGPYRLLHSRAKLVEGDLLRAQGLPSHAAAAVEEAYRHAWCDGPPHACTWCLNEARRRLDEWKVPIPQFDIAPRSAAEIVAATGPIFDDSEY